MTENQDIQALTEDQESSIDWVELISVLWGSRKLIATVTAIATVGAVIISLLLPEYYKSSATLLPGWSPALSLLRERAGGKAELHRTQCSVPRSPGDGKESATENIPSHLFMG